MNHMLCPNCSGKIKYPAEYAGKRAKCPKCTHAFRLPSGAQDDFWTAEPVSNGKVRFRLKNDWLQSLSESDRNRMTFVTQFPNGVVISEQDVEKWVDRVRKILSQPKSRPSYVQTPGEQETIVPLIQHKRPDISITQGVALLKQGGSDAIEMLARLDDDQLEAILKEYQEIGETEASFLYLMAKDQGIDHFRAHAASEKYRSEKVQEVQQLRQRIRERKCHITREPPSRVPKESIPATTATPDSTSSWEPVTPQVSCRMPFAALEQIFIFTSGDGNTALDSKVAVGMLQDAVMKPLGAIVGRVPIDVIGRSDVAAQIIRDGSIPESAWLAMASIKPRLAQGAQDGLYRVCVRPFPTETGQTVALVLLYNKQRL